MKQQEQEQVILGELLGELLVILVLLGDLPGELLGVVGKSIPGHQHRDTSLSPVYHHASHTSPHCLTRARYDRSNHTRGGAMRTLRVLHLSALSHNRATPLHTVLYSKHQEKSPGKITSPISPDLLGRILLPRVLSLDGLVVNPGCSR